MDLLQNCDLPPPLKLFPPLEADDKKRTATIPKISQWDEGMEPINQTENTSLLRALQLSQSRAREAEKKAAAATRENQQMAAVMMEESLKISAHRQWVRMLDMEILLLHEDKKKMKMKMKMKMMMNDREDEEEDVNVPTLTWCFTLALCLGIGFALGRYMF